MFLLKHFYSSIFFIKNTKKLLFNRRIIILFVPDAIKNIQNYLVHFLLENKLKRLIYVNSEIKLQILDW